jgi:hypothetical protein
MLGSILTPQLLFLTYAYYKHIDPLGFCRLRIFSGTFSFIYASKLTICLFVTPWLGMQTLLESRYPLSKIQGSVPSERLDASDFCFRACWRDNICHINK